MQVLEEEEEEEEDGNDDDDDEEGEEEEERNSQSILPSWRSIVDHGLPQVIGIRTVFRIGVMNRVDILCLLSVYERCMKNRIPCLSFLRQRNSCFSLARMGDICKNIDTYRQP